jgi:membrane protein implicated in regulation of membrane protease activity
MQLDLVEFLAPFYALVAIAGAVLAIWQAIDRTWDAAATLGAIAFVLGLVAVAGYRRRRRRDRQEDPWQPL